MTDLIYLDHNATTPVAPEVFAARRPGCESTSATRRAAMPTVAEQRGPWPTPASRWPG